MIRSTSSSIDKIDKLPWDKVREEMLQKGLPLDITERLATYFANPTTASSMAQALKAFKENQYLRANEQMQKGIEDMEQLLEYLAAYRVVDAVMFDLTLARGLDYYTGLIYEVAPDLLAVDKVTAEKLRKIGSIAAGGRYDNLVGSFSGTQMPCVGVSFGIDRILAMLSLQEQNSAQKPQEPRVDVWLIASGRTAIHERLSIAHELRRAGFSVDFSPRANQKPRKQFETAQSNAAIAVFIEESSLAAGIVRYKILRTKAETDVKREDLAESLKEMLG